MSSTEEIVNQVESPDTCYKQFADAADLMPIINIFKNLCSSLNIDTNTYDSKFTELKTKLTTWKCKTLFSKLEEKSRQSEYQSKPCKGKRILIIGGGPVGLRAAIDAALLGAEVVVVEKRDSYSRNNVLHLWPYVVADLTALGVKSFYQQFCVGGLDHISIRRLQCLLLKVSLLFGVQIYTSTTFTDVLEPQNEGEGWHAKFERELSPLHSIEFDAIFGCDAKNNALKFKRKGRSSKLAIAITCNFVNRRTSKEACVSEINGLISYCAQDFFKNMKDEHGIDLENVVYYRDETHYFVMTATKKSLIDKGVLKENYNTAFELLSRSNVNYDALLEFAKVASVLSTENKLPNYEFERNHHGNEDVAMFDFTSMYTANNASRILERKGKRLLLCIAGDVLLEPFWPQGTGAARGFLGAIDDVWMFRGFCLGQHPLDLLQERESIFGLLPQTNTWNMDTQFNKYTINPHTRYMRLNTKSVSKDDVAHLYDTSDNPVKLGKWIEKGSKKEEEEEEEEIREIPDMGQY